MTYEDTNYFCFCFYSDSDLYKDKEVRITIDNSLNNFLQNIQRLDIKQSAINRIEEFKLETIRKVKLKSNPIEAIFDKVSQSLDLNILIHDSNWTNESAPRLIINIYCSNTTEFNGRNIPENPKMFFIAAVSKEFSIEENILISMAKTIFDLTNGIKGGIWENTKYTLYGGTPIAWAFQNFPGNRTYSSLEEWNPNFDYIMAKTKANNE